MAVESHIPFGSESGLSQGDDGFEPAKSRRKSRRGRRAERTRTGERMPEPHTIWTREDPNHLQPLKVESSAVERSAVANGAAAPVRDEQKPAKKVEREPKPARVERVAETSEDAKPTVEKRHQEASEPVSGVDTEQTFPLESAMPAPQKREAFARKGPQPESLADLLKLQELPKLSIHPRHFYTEPEVRQPDTTEVEHDILPSAGQERQQPKPAAHEAPTASKQKDVLELQPESELKSLTPSPKEARPSPSRPSNETVKHDNELQAIEAPGQSEQLRAGEQLQRTAEETAKRATELADKDKQHAQPEEQQHIVVAPEATQGEKPAKPESSPGDNETDVRMEQADLLALSSSIRVDGVSVSEMFRAGRLDEEGLRRVVAAFLRGHDVQRVIAEEVLRVQMRFELDPQLRKTTMKRSSRATKRAAAHATTQAKKVLDPKRARYHADRLADHLVGGLDRMIEVAEDKPNTAKSVGIALAVVVYFVILFLILKS